MSFREFIFAAGIVAIPMLSVACSGQRRDAQAADRPSLGSLFAANALNEVLMGVAREHGLLVRYEGSLGLSQTRRGLRPPSRPDCWGFSSGYGETPDGSIQKLALHLFRVRLAPASSGGPFDAIFTFRGCSYGLRIEEIVKKGRPTDPLPGYGITPVDLLEGAVRRMAEQQAE